MAASLMTLLSSPEVHAQRDGMMNVHSCGARQINLKVVAMVRSILACSRMWALTPVGARGPLRLRAVALAIVPAIFLTVLVGQENAQAQDIVGQAQPQYAYSATVDKGLVIIDEGKSDLVTYTFSNLGTLPIYAFDISLSRSQPVGPDPTDNAFAQYAGPVLSLGQQVDPGHQFNFQYLLTTDLDGTESPLDFGSQIFAPNLNLHQGDKITSPFLPGGSGTTSSFEVVVRDVPEPNSIVLFGIGSIITSGYMWRRKRTSLAAAKQGQSLLQLG